MNRIQTEATAYLNQRFQELGHLHPGEGSEITRAYVFAANRDPWIPVSDTEGLKKGDLIIILNIGKYHESIAIEHYNVFPVWAKYYQHFKAPQHTEINQTSKPEINK